MFGMKMLVNRGEELQVFLRPFEKEELSLVTKGFQSPTIHRYTRQIFAQTLENEEEWYHRVRRSETDCVWAIVVAGSNFKHSGVDCQTPIGVTGIHGIDQWGGGRTGIVIWDHRVWGLGVASAAHLGRTLFVADFLNRNTLRSSVMVGNNSSLNALKRVGYTVCGTNPRHSFREGKWLDEFQLTWLNPRKISDLYPEGLPGKFKRGVKRAEKALETAREFVIYPC